MPFFRMVPGFEGPLVWKRKGPEQKGILKGLWKKTDYLFGLGGSKLEYQKNIKNQILSDRYNLGRLGIKVGEELGRVIGVFALNLMDC
uniref:Uncharacterized protein n=1 Tax=Nelumbo nucifera TaxID=4432 RepID=A0A822ZBJ6_NELNU|nr:TPA_asm: hypothetical protein HUJ06_015152 [Nelumbo nucifera]